MLSRRYEWRSATSSFLDWPPSCFSFVRDPAHTEDMAMESGIGFVAVAVAIFVSFAVALGMEWLSLVLLMRLMPARPVVQTVRRGWRRFRCRMALVSRGSGRRKPFFDYRRGLGKSKSTTPAEKAGGRHKGQCDGHGKC